MLKSILFREKELHFLHWQMDVQYSVRVKTSTTALDFESTVITFTTKANQSEYTKCLKNSRHDIQGITKFSLLIQLKKIISLANFTYKRG